MHAAPHLKYGHHFYRFLNYLYNNKKDILSKKYFVLVDDDTWVNIPMVLRFMQPYRPDLNIQFMGM